MRPNTMPTGTDAGGGVQGTRSVLAERARLLEDKPAWFRAFANLRREHGFEPLRAEGTIPEDLAGTLYRNGTALFNLFGHRYNHWFDGEGAVTAVRFGGGRAEGATRIVESRALREERLARRAFHRAFGTPGKGLHRWTMPKNSASTSVLAWQGRLFALYESALPTEVRPEDLSTVGETDLGVIPMAFSAHPHRVPARKAAYNFGLSYGRFTKLHLFELPDAGGARRLGSVKLGFPAIVHDFLATERHAVFLVHPYKVHPLKMLLGLATPSACIRYEPALGSEAIVVPWDDVRAPVRFKIDPFTQWHFVGGYERGGEIVADLSCYDAFDLFEATGRVMEGRIDGMPGKCVRATIDPRARRMRTETLWEGPGELPTISPRAAAAPYRYAYFCASPSKEAARGEMPTATAKLDVETGAARSVVHGPGLYPSEPIFVPRPGGAAEDDGWLLALVYDSGRHQSYVAVMDARDLAREPLARVWFDQHIPFTFHGTFVEGP